MCNDDIRNYNSKISDLGPLTPSRTLKMKRPASNGAVKEKQRSDTTLKKYWDLVNKPESKGKPQFIAKKDILL